MFGSNHYIPILRWKQAERFALHRLRSEDKARITPLIEITPKSFLAKKRDKGISSPEPDSLIPDGNNLAPEPGAVLRRHAKEVLRFWGNTPLFLDLNHIEGVVPAINGDIHALTYFSDVGRSYCLKIVPVTELERSAAYQNAVAAVLKTDQSGVCLRVSISELVDNACNERLQNGLARLGARVNQTDLLLDYGVFDPDAPTILELLAHVPRLKDWRSLTVARGAFPKDLQGFKPGSHKIVRSDWINWRNESRKRGRLRWPSFSDYTVQYGRYVEPVDNANPSASIRYTLPEEWLIMRGEGIFNDNGPGRAQWNANAMLLSERDEFYGSNFSDGDTYIDEMSRKQKDHGSPMTWIRAGLNHHMSVAARQIAAL
jgi:Beta protein